MRRALTAVLLAVVTACASSSVRVTRALVAPGQLANRGEDTYLKAHLADGRVYVFSRWFVSGDQVHGAGSVWDVYRVKVEHSANLTLSTHDVVLFETNELTHHQGANAGFVIALAAVTAGVLLTLLLVEGIEESFGP